MNNPHADLPPNVRAAIAQGNLIEAIKHLRSMRTMTLKEAKDRIDAEVLHQSANRQAGSSPFPVNLPPLVLAALQRGDQNQAVKLLAAQTGWPLPQAKHAIDDYLAAKPTTNKHSRKSIEAVQSDAGGGRRIAMVIIALLLAIIWWRHGF